MVCEKCGFKNYNDAKKCIQCGYEMDENKPEDEAALYEGETSYFKTDSFQTRGRSFFTVKKAYMGGMISSIVAILFGIIMLSGAFTTKVTMHDTSSGVTTYTSYSYYGGDAYTGMQQASADASNNAKAAAENVAETNAILSKSANGYNGIQNTVSGCMGLMTIALGAIGFFGFLVGYNKED